MNDKENTPGKGKLGRLILDALAVTGGLVALFQFIFSDDVSSQWFRSLMNWMLRALGELIAWWDKFREPLTLEKGQIQFNEWLPASTYFLLVSVYAFMFIVGYCFVSLIVAVKLGENYGHLIFLSSVFALFSLDILWTFAAATAPLSIWVPLAVTSLFTGIGRAVWKRIPSPKKESHSEERSLLIK